MLILLKIKSKKNVNFHINCTYDVLVSFWNRYHEKSESIYERKAFAKEYLQFVLMMTLLIVCIC